MTITNTSAFIAAAFVSLLTISVAASTSPLTLLAA